MPLNKENRLESLRSKVSGTIGSKVGLDGNIFELCTLVGGWGDITGREFEVKYEGNKIIKIIQKPIRLSVLMSLIKEAQKHNERQEKASKTKGPKGRKR